MQKDAFIRTRISSGLKARVESILEKLGLNTTDAVNLFFHQVEMHNGLPFDVKIPNAETIQAIKEYEEGKDLTTYSLAEFKQSLGL